MSMMNCELISFLGKIARDIQVLAGLSKPVFVNNVEEYLGNGKVSSFFDEIDTASIGIKELSANPDGDVNDYTFMKGFMALIHEFTHIYQREKLLRVNNKSSKYLAVNYMAISASDKYYKSNYKIMPCEIAAQYSAIKNGYSSLTKMF